MILRNYPRRLLCQLAASFSDNYPKNGKPPPMKPFDPVEHGLSPNFVLTNFTKMKG